MIPDTPNKIFMGGIPATLTEDQVRELVSPFGELRAFSLIKDAATNNSRVCHTTNATLSSVLLID
jgi:splicing factor U2AF 65 kDa subunit